MYELTVILPVSDVVMGVLLAVGVVVLVKLIRVVVELVPFL